MTVDDGFDNCSSHCFFYPKIRPMGEIQGLGRL